MAKMVNPELEVVRFENEDVIATSGRRRLQFYDNTWSLDGTDYNSYEELVRDITRQDYNAENNNGKNIYLYNGDTTTLYEAYNNTGFTNHSYVGDDTYWSVQ